MKTQLEAGWSWRSMVVLVGVVGLGACAGAPPPSPAPPAPPQPQFGPAPMVSVLTPGVSVRAEDESFTLSGTPSAAPFDVGGDCILRPTTNHVGAAQYYGARRVVISLSPELAKIAGQDQLYGVLALCGVPAGASGAAVNQYALQLPPERIEQTSGGRVSLVYESFVGQRSDQQAWMLWLSRTPPPPRPAGPPPGVQTPLSMWRAQAGPSTAATPTAGAAPTRPKASVTQCNESWTHYADLIVTETLSRQPPENRSPEKDAQMRERMQASFDKSRAQFLNSCPNLPAKMVQCQIAAPDVSAYSNCFKVR